MAWAACAPIRLARQNRPLQPAWPYLQDLCCTSCRSHIDNKLGVIGKFAAEEGPPENTVSIERLTQDLALDLPWIGRYDRRVASLLALLEEAEQARAVHGPALIARLLGRFTFLSVEQYEQSLLDMAMFIDEAFDLTTTVLCATTADRQKDSAQRVLYDLVSTLAAIGRYKVRSLNRYDAAAKENFCSCVLLLSRHH